jgi:transcriptional regulator with XRE-family HTH domain
MLYLRKIRKDRKIPQGVLAEMIGVSQGQLSLIEHGKYQPRIETIIKITRILNVDAIELMAEWDELDDTTK